jgi:hypothetical protein
VLTEWALSRIEKSDAYLPDDNNISRSGTTPHSLILNLEKLILN